MIPEDTISDQKTLHTDNNLLPGRVNHPARLTSTLEDDQSSVLSTGSMASKPQEHEVQEVPTTYQCVSAYASSSSSITPSIKSCMKSSSRMVDPRHVCDPPGPFKLGVNENDFSSSVGDEMKMLLRRLLSLDGGCSSYPTAIPSYSSSSYSRPRSNSTGAAQQRSGRRGSLNSMGGYSTSSLSTLDETAASVDWGPTTTSASANNLLLPMRNGTKSRHEDFGNNKANSAPDVNALRRKMRGMSAELSTGSLRNAMNRNVPMSTTSQKNENWSPPPSTERMTASTNAMSLLAALASGNCRNGSQDETKKKHTQNESKPTSKDMRRLSDPGQEEERSIPPETTVRRKSLESDGSSTSSNIDPNVKCQDDLFSRYLAVKRRSSSSQPKVGGQLLVDWGEGRDRYISVNRNDMSSRRISDLVTEGIDDTNDNNVIVEKKGGSTVTDLTATVADLSIGLTPYR